LINGHNLINDCLSKGSESVTIDRVIRTTNGSASGIQLSVTQSLVVCNTISGSISENWIDINKFYEMLGKCDLDGL
jgi:hypothetical protein